jgi:hypothetical protein
LSLANASHEQEISGQEKNEVLLFILHCPEFEFLPCYMPGITAFSTKATPAGKTSPSEYFLSRFPLIALFVL